LAPIQALLNPLPVTLSQLLGNLTTKPSPFSLYGSVGNSWTWLAIYALTLITPVIHTLTHTRIAQRFI
jgi:hypothetical protein